MSTDFSKPEWGFNFLFTGLDFFSGFCQLVQDQEFTADFGFDILCFGLFVDCLFILDQVFSIFPLDILISAQALNSS